MFKLGRSDVCDLVAVVGVDPESEGLARAAGLGLAASAGGLDWLLEEGPEVAMVFDATSAAAHVVHAPRLAEAGIASIDLTPAKLGPAVVPVVNGLDLADAPDVSLLTCGGQATIPIVAAVSRVADVAYAEIVATIASRSAGPGTRQNIDEFTHATAKGLEEVGGAAKGKAIIVLNPADPPILMRNTVYCLVDERVDRDAIRQSIREMVQSVAAYVPGYRLRGEPVFDGDQVTVMVEVEGSGDYLEPFAGNLDIMTAAAVRVGEIRARMLMAGVSA